MTGTDARELGAVKKAQRLGLAARVRRVRLGVYLVPSTSDLPLTYSVTGIGPRLADYRCVCPAASYGNVCAHVAAVALRRVQEQALSDRRKQLARRAEKVA